MNNGTRKELDVFERIRAACRYVADRAEDVRIRTDRIEAYAEAFSLDEFDIVPLDADRHFVGDEEETIAYFVTLDTINFGSGYFPYLTKRPGMSGYYSIASALADRFRAGGPIPASELRTLSARKCAQIFEQGMSCFPIRELMELFARALNDLGRHLVDRFGGRFEDLTASADGSAARLVSLLSAQLFFRDEVSYRGLLIPLYKRAQLLASDLALAFGGEGPGRFDDLDRLTVFADNVVPHVLRIDGLLDYSESLAAAIDGDELIRAGSDEEIEIRACAVHCVERVREVLTRGGCPITSRQLDQMLWHRGRQVRYKSIKRHRTRTVFY